MQNYYKTTLNPQCFQTAHYVFKESLIGGQPIHEGPPPILRRETDPKHPGRRGCLGRDTLR